MTAHVTTSAARGGGAGVELVRMLASFVWVAGATVVTIVFLGALPGWITGGRGTVREVATIQDAERRLGARVLVPGYFPERLVWPPKAIRVAGGRRGSVRLDLAARSGPDLQIFEATREGEPIAPELLGARTVLRSSRTAVGTLPATLSDVLADGTLHRELAFELNGWAVVLRSSGDVEELFRMARTSHRQGGAR
jgi:hypothetical protein